MALAIICALVAVVRLAGRFNLTEDQVVDLALIVIACGLLGARIYFVFYDWQYYSTNLGEGYKIWGGGLAIHGAIIGGALGALIYAKIKKIKLFTLTDLLALVLPLGQAIGRFGNYFNQELFGGPTNYPWGIPIEIDKRPPGFEDYTYFHPTFLYESLLDLFLFFSLSLLHFKYKKIKPGILTGAYLAGYGAIRLLMETLRLDYSPVYFGWRQAQIASGILIIFGLAVFIQAAFFQKKSPKIML